MPALHGEKLKNPFQHDDTCTWQGISHIPKREMRGTASDPGHSLQGPDRPGPARESMRRLCQAELRTAGEGLPF